MKGRGRGVRWKEGLVSEGEEERGRVGDGWGVRYEWGERSIRRREGSNGGGSKIEVIKSKYLTSH